MKASVDVRSRRRYRFVVAFAMILKATGSNYARVAANRDRILSWTPLRLG